TQPATGETYPKSDLFNKAQQITHRSFEPFIRAIQAQISPCCNCIIAGGIDTAEILAQITPFDFHALQGCLWPAVPINQITTLVQR
ncbi:hypothetical protein FSG54_019795, partial [Escherichia coli]|nr:hypothetical protein [Escherichia coli]